MTKTMTDRAAIFFVALSLALGISVAPAPTSNRGIPQTNNNYNAAVTIKTQKAADSIEGGVRGIDVSKWQGSINWGKVAQDNVSFAMIRATYGAEYDPMFLTNARGAHENGLKVGAYHYARFKNSAGVEAEAAAFLNRIKQVDITYPVVLDIENHYNLKRSTLTNLAIEFMDIIKAQGYTVMLYSFQNFITGHLDTSKLSGYDMWVANYIEQPNSIDHKMWQHTSYGTVSGINGRVDINIAYNDFSTRKKTTVNKAVSTNIKETLNARYKVGLPIDGLDMALMNEAIAKGLQKEINKQWGENIAVDGELDAHAMSYLEGITFTGETHGNITYLIQAKLFYLGHYKGELTSYFDQGTVEAVKKYQISQDISSTGDLDEYTLNYLLR